jgi:hypothetical protein
LSIRERSVQLVEREGVRAADVNLDPVLGLAGAAEYRQDNEFRCS